MFSQETVLVIAGAIIALGSSLLTAWAQHRFSINQEKHNRWWERKTEAYTKIVEALNDIIDYDESLLEEDLYGKVISEENKQELQSRWKEAQNNIEKTARVGRFLISREATQELRRYLAPRDPENQHPNLQIPWFEEVEADLRLASKSLETIVEIARKDLGIDKQ